MVFPVTPSALEISVPNKNETVTLINEGEVNILKSPGLSEFTFTARLPRRPQPYTYTSKIYPVDHYLTILEKLKVDKIVSTFIVDRWAVTPKTLSDSAFEQTKIKVSLEEYTISEDSENGDDVLVDITLKKYVDYKTVRKKLSKSNSGSSSGDKLTTAAKNLISTMTKQPTSSKTYTVKKGDCLWKISKKFYGKGSQWKKIYKANKSTIEKAAKKHGRKSSSNGHWIYPGTKLKIPK